jgi:arylsulfatase A-like enzyme
LRSPAAKKPFLLWAFHFDAHAWREINDEHIHHLQDQYSIPDDGEHNLRYRAVARSIDAQLGRMLAALKQTGLEKNTAIVFLSDHGEGLGQSGFWVHSIFLWESLVHVPLVMRVPGIPAQTISRPVSLVDIAPTLAPLIGEGSAVFHGEDLLSQLDLAPPRRHPILLRAGEFQGHDRVGMVDERTKRKLVLRLFAAHPELHAYEEDPFDGNNLARDEPGRVRQMVHTIARSPVFPRGEEDFKLHAHPDELGAASAVAHGPTSAL